MAPIYRKTWWPAHRAANRDWRSSMQGLVERHGPPVLQFITRAYGTAWPVPGYRIHVSAYSNWAGAYSTRGPLLVVSSLDAGIRELRGLEIVFHERRQGRSPAPDRGGTEEGRRLGRRR